MNNFFIKSFTQDFKELHKQIGLEIIKDWAWPFESFLEHYDESSFDPDIALSCFKDTDMVGYVIAKISGEGPAILPNEGMAAYLDIPRVLPDFEEAADLLMENIIEVLRNKGAKFIRTRVSTMRKNSIQLAEKWGFEPTKNFPLGYKIYYHYELQKGKQEYMTRNLLPFNSNRDLEECSTKVAYYFKMPLERAKKWILEIDSQKDLVSHYVIREENELVGYCLPCVNSLNNGIIASCYLEASKEEYFKQLVIQTINDSFDKKYETYLIDLIGKLLDYRKVAESLGFINVAEWGIYEKKLI